MARMLKDKWFWAALAALALTGGGRGGDAWAALSLDVDPLRGGRDINFETVRPGHEIRNEEVRFTVTNTQAGEQYQLTYSLMSPIVSDRGNVLPPDKIKMFSPTSVPGVLRVALATPLRLGSEVLYTSDSSGTSVAFDVVLALESGELSSSETGLPAGIYRTQVVYTLAAVNGGSVPVTVVQNIQIEIASVFEADVRNRRGAQALDLGRVSAESPGGEDVLTIRIQPGGAQSYRVTQSCERLTGGTADFIDPDRTEFEASTGRKGTLSESPRVVLSSDGASASGEAQVIYRFKGTGGEIAGEYRSLLILTVELDGVPARTFTLPLRLEIPSVFKLEVQNDNGGSFLRFGDFKPNDTTKTQRVRLAVLNNTGRSYQVNQFCDGPLTSPEGRIVPDKNFSLQVKGPRENSFLASAKTPVSAGTSVVFSSDSKGTPAELELEYELAIGREQTVGEYTTNITYSLETS